MRFVPARTPILIKKVFGGLVWDRPTKAKKIYLTFDDGPIPDVTPFVLKTLADYDAKATFFCIGDNVARHPELFNEIINQGHRIGNHTQQHVDAWKTSKHSYLQNIKEASGTFSQNSPIDFRNTKQLFRPPYGKITPSLIRRIKKLGYAVVMWDVLSFDWRKDQSPSACLETVLTHSQPGSIIVFHDSKKAFQNMSYALPKVLAHFKQKGYTFEHL